MTTERSLRPPAPAPRLTPGSDPWWRRFHTIRDRARTEAEETEYRAMCPAADRLLGLKGGGG